MKNYKFFNKQRVNTQDLNNMQLWQRDNLSTELGSLMNYGILRQSDTIVCGSSDGSNILLEPADWTITQVGSTAFANISVTTPGTDALFAYDRGGNLIYIPVDSTYLASPTEFENTGNTNLPLASGDGYYYFWVGYKDTTIASTTYSKLDKDGNTHAPKIVSGYTITIEYSATSITTPTPPGGADLILIGSVNYKASGLATFTTDYSKVLYASIKAENVNVTIDTANPPATYANGEIKSLKDHINAIGDASIVNALNPHGVAPVSIGAVSLSDVSIDKQILKNGIVSCDTSGALLSDYYSNTTEFQGLINNSPGNTYVYIMQPAYSGFMWNGRLREATELSNWSTPIAQVDFTAGVDATGWYQIIIDETAPGILSLTKQAVSVVDFYQPEDSTQISLGYVYWLTSGALQKNETTAATTGESILPFYTWATLNSKQISKNVSSNLMHSQNLMEPAVGGNNSLTYGVPTGYSNQYTATISGVGTWTATVNAPYSNRIRVQGASGFDGQFSLYTKQVPYNTNKASGSKSYYTLSFNYSGTDSFDNSAVTVNGTIYYLPKIDGAIARRFYVVLNNYPSSGSIDWRFQVATSSDSSVYISNVQLVEGCIPSDVFLSDTVYTSQIVLDTNVSSSSDKLTVIEKRTQLQNKNLDLILKTIPIGDATVKYVNATSSNFTTYSNDATNLEIWFVRGISSRSTTFFNSPGALYDGSYTASYSWSSAYSLVYADLKIHANYPDTFNSTDRYWHTSYDYSQTANAVAFTKRFRWIGGNFSSEAQWESFFPDSFQFDGILIMQKL